MSTTVTAEGITITRVFDAPREAVFAAWTDPKQFAVWFGGEATVLEDVVMDVRPAGTWRATMILPGGSTIPWSGTYHEVVPPERLAFTLTDQPGVEGEPCTVVLTATDEGTHMVFTQTGSHLTEEQYGQAANGWGTFFDAMENLLP